MFGWLKTAMPKGIYGRGALILLVPIITLQLVMSVVFIQRHFEGVTEQMTRNLLTGVSYLLAEVEAAADADSALAAAQALEGPLAIRAGLAAIAPLGPLPQADARRAYDLSGRAVIATLRGALPGLVAVDLLENRREVRVHLLTRHGPLLLVIDRSRVSASNPHQLLVIVLFTGFLMTVIAFLFLRNQLRPIRRLAEAAEAFGQGRTLPYRLAGAREVRAAGQAFLDMRDRIERQIEQRTLMLSGVSHDLRTPLTRMRLGLSMMPESDETAALLHDLADMERLIDAFLAYARGEEPEDPVPCDAVALVSDLVTRARRSGARVELADTSAAPAGSGNLPDRIRPQLLSRAVENLIGNAVRYGGSARVGVCREAGALRIAVEDPGPGIPLPRREEAMRPFTRLDDARNQNLGGGVGLGLTIARDAVRRHGGSLTLGESAALGGLRAEIVLPAGDAAAAGRYQSSSLARS